MKAIVATDSEQRYEACLKLLEALDFNSPHIDLVHVEKVASPVAATVGASRGATPKAAKANGPQGRQVLQKAVQLAGKLDPAAREILLEGPTAPRLIEYAEKAHADIVCATAHLHGALQCFVLGSVCRALVLGCRQSVLIAKGMPNLGHALRVVVATDHSEYAQKSIDRFFELEPAGIDEVTVLSVVEQENYIPFSPEAAQVMVDEQAEHWAEVERKTEQLRLKFERLGAIAHSKVKIDDPRAQIAETMQQTGADLLVIGAQGHGFFRNMVLGSVSLHEVVAERYPVLVMRV